MLVIVVISVDVYPFLAFSDLTCLVGDSIPKDIYGGVDVSKVPGCHLLLKMSD